MIQNADPVTKPAAPVKRSTVVITFDCNFATDSVNSITIDLPGRTEKIQHPLDRETCQTHRDRLGDVRRSPFQVIVTDSSKQNWQVENWSIRFRKLDRTGAESPFDPDSRVFTGSASAPRIERGFIAYDLVPAQDLIFTELGKWQYLLTLDFGQTRGSRKGKNGITIDPEMEVGF